MRIVTLLSDFGSTSPYPAEVKAILRASCRAAIIDITHDVPPHDIAHGAFLLATAAPTFPTGTIHLAIVDPGVGTARRALAVAAGGQFLAGPDNGLLLPAARRLGTPRAFALDATRFARPAASQTFHGRDLFAPAAAALAMGLPIERAGAAITDLVEIAQTGPTRQPGALRGQVLFRDRFGNLITNIPGEWLDGLPDRMTLSSPRGARDVRRVRAYGDGGADEPVALTGSGGTVEIAVNTGRAGDLLALGPGDPVTFASAPPRA